MDERPRLLGLAYRMLGTVSDAEDVVQEAWVRWSGADHRAIRRPAAWLTTVTTRLALDRSRTLRRRREAYVGPWLPEPVTTEPGPEERAELAESLTLGFLVLLEALSPTERAVFLLADVFAAPYSEIAGAVGKTEASCRQIASRARRKLREQTAPSPTAADLGMLQSLLVAFSAGDVDRVLQLLDPDVVLVSDGGPGRRAARRPVRGADRVIRLAMNLTGRFGNHPISSRQVNGFPSVVIHHPEGSLVFQAETRDGLITLVRVLMNPDKLTRLDAAAPLI